MITVKQVDINGQLFPVRYDMNALCELEELTGQNTLSGTMTFDMKCLRALAYVGLKHGYKYQNNNTKQFAKTIEDVGSWMDVKFLKLFPPVLFEFTNGEQENKPESEKAQEPGELAGASLEKLPLANLG
jgi:hypothetical protein